MELKTVNFHFCNYSFSIKFTFGTILNLVRVLDKNHVLFLLTEGSADETLQILLLAAKLSLPSEIDFVCWKIMF